MKTILCTALLVILSVTSLMAQPGFAPDTGDVAPIPGIFYAVVAAMGIAVYKLRSKK